MPPAVRAPSQFRPGSDYTGNNANWLYLHLPAEATTYTDGSVDYMKYGEVGVYPGILPHKRALTWAFPAPRNFPEPKEDKPPCCRACAVDPNHETPQSLVDHEPSPTEKAFGWAFAAAVAFYAFAWAG